MEIVRKVMGPIGTNVYFVFDRSTKECVVIDPADDAPRIEKYLKSEGLKVSNILLTHGHFDHIMAAEDLRKDTGAKLWALDKEKETLLDPNLNGDARFMRKNLQLTPDEFFHDGDVLKLLGHDWKVIWTPGHTEGSCCFYIEDEKVLFSGDTLFQGSFGRFDMPGGDFSKISNSLRNVLFRLPEDVVVFPGHMDETTIGFERKYNPIW